MERLSRLLENGGATMAASTCTLPQFRTNSVHPDEPRRAAACQSLVHPDEPHDAVALVHPDELLDAPGARSLVHPDELRRPRRGGAWFTRMNRMTRRRGEVGSPG
jgi:sugar lactone lactonase YvrE